MPIASQFTHSKEKKSKLGLSLILTIFKTLRLVARTICQPSLFLVGERNLKIGQNLAKLAAKYSVVFCEHGVDVITENDLA